MSERNDNTNAASLMVMLQPSRDWLKMELPPSAEVAVFGWTQRPSPVDAGVPAEIAALFSRALTHSFRVTFLDPEQQSSPQWRDRGDRWVRTLPSAGWFRFFHNRDLALVSTLEPDLAQHLFETASAWSREAQLVLLTARTNGPPELPAKTIKSFFEDSEPDMTGVSQLYGMLHPGPDGDFAQLTMFRKNSLHPVLTELQQEARTAGLGFEIVSPEAFRQTLYAREKVEN